MNAAATHTLRSITDITFAYGVSDEYSFVFDRDTKLFERRRDKLVSTVASTFTAAYIHNWAQDSVKHTDPATISTTDLNAKDQKHSIGRPLHPAYLPTFDARAITYPTTSNLRDYLSWRQVDCHINNLYNTTFWALVQQGGMSTTEAEEELKGTVASGKHEILFTRFGINYNKVSEMERKGSVMFRDWGWPEQEEGEVRGKKEDVVGNMDGGREGEGGGKEASKTQKEKPRKAKMSAKIVVEHVDIIKGEFWEKRPWILGGRAVR